MNNIIQFGAKVCIHIGKYDGIPRYIFHFLDTPPKPSLLHSGLVHTNLVHLSLANAQDIQNSSREPRQKIQHQQEFQSRPSHSNQSNQENPELILSARRIQDNHQAKVINVQPIATDC